MNFSTKNLIKKYSLSKIDTHTHTYYSFDCSENRNTPSKMCEAAAGAGLDAIVLTDHIEVNSEAEHIYPPFYYGARRSECEAAKKEFSGKLDVYLGIELGQAVHYPDLAKKIVDENIFDYVIGSVHSTRGEEDFYYVDFTKITYSRATEMIDKYFDEYYEMTKLPFVDQCAHLTYPLRYLKAAGLDVKLDRWEDKIKLILKSIVDSGKTLEFNTNCIRKGISLPDDIIVSMYRDLGGTDIRVGSDAHHPEDVAADFGAACETIEKIYGGT